MFKENNKDIETDIGHIIGIVNDNYSENVTGMELYSLDYEQPHPIMIIWACPWKNREHMLRENLPI